MKPFFSLFVCVLATVTGCSESEVPQGVSNAQSSAESSRYLADVEPPNAVPVGEALRSSGDAEPAETAEPAGSESDAEAAAQSMAVMGVIGGSADPFVEGLAAFTIVDPKVPYCAADEGCPTPWDYCCTQDQVKNNIATVKLVDHAGQPVSGDARSLLGVRELSTVVVQGKAHRDAQGNLSIAATRVFVRTADK